MPEQFIFSPNKNNAYEIKWRVWGENAFKEAKENDKPILLSISAVWCHWCHVMDETSYSYKPNINLINDEFIPIRVDNDKRPDINRRFNMGGWPTTAILTPEGEILNGGTYFPEKTLYTFLSNNLKHYKLKEFININNEDIENTSSSTNNSNINEKTLEYLDNILRSSFDKQFGGFGVEPKFPQTDALSYLINRFYNNTSSEMFTIVTKTLDNMANGGIFDNVEGGFFRYSTKRDWSIPHFEKMLEDNCKLLDIYLKAYSITKDKKYFEISNKIIEYLINNLFNSENGFFNGSQDADEHYYSLDEDGRKRIKKPYIDKTMYTNWNALAVTAFVRAYYTVNYNEGINIAKRVMAFIIEKCFDKNNGMYHYYSALPSVEGILEDQVEVIDALINLYEITSDYNYMNIAMKLGDVIIEKYYDKQNGGFFDDIISNNFASKIPMGDKSIYSNSICCEVLYRLNDYSNSEKYKEAADKTIALFGEEFTEYEYLAAGFGNSVTRYLSQPVKISVIGDIEDKNTIEMYMESIKKFIPFRIIELLDIKRDKEKIKSYGYESQKMPTGYICKGNTCFEPAFTVNEVIKNINDNIM